MKYMNLLKRLGTVIVGAPLLLFIFYTGGLPFMLFLGLLVLVSTMELRDLFKKKDIFLNFAIVPLALFVYYCTAVCSFPLIFLSLFTSFFVMLSIDLFSDRLEGSVSRISGSIFILVYISMFLASYYRITLLNNGRFLALALLILVWFTDSFAYICGMTLGIKRNIFKASPKKSIGGFTGGIIFTFIGGWGLARLFPSYVSLPEMLMAAIAAGFFGQIGDLFESVIKRDFHVKDASDMLPGHGGILDRFDSIYISAPVYFILLKLYHEGLLWIN